MKVFCLSLLLVSALHQALHTADAAKAHALIHHGVHRQLQHTGRVNIVAAMRTPPQAALESVDVYSNASRGSRIASLVDRMQALSTNSQRSIDQLLTHEACSRLDHFFDQQHHSWIMNARYFQGATLAWVEALAQLPEVAEIREEEAIEIAEDQERFRHLESIAEGNTSSPQPGIARIHAPNLWKRGITGSGVVVGSIDSGVLATHQLLRSNFRQEYGWFSPGERSSEPSDRKGHGTHTVGTMVGAGGIGVAPGAQWIACQACVTSCTEAAIVQCTEWMLCPTDPFGRNKDCAKAPHVINNSWSTRSGKRTHQPIIDAWVAAGIVPIFSNGNDGPTCRTVGSPGDYANVISVGNIAADGSLARSSSRGPTTSGIIKPDLSAPGQAITSAGYLGDDSLRVVSGTSMAAPHVAGAVALLLSAEPRLSVAAIRELLTSSADQSNVRSDESSCSAFGAWPNNEYGHGVLDVYAAYAKLNGEAPPVPSSPPSTSSTCKLEYDVDLVGNDLGNAASMSAFPCCALCLEVAKCRGFTWSTYNGGTCWFKDQASGVRTPSSGVVSALVDRDSSAHCRVSIDSDFAGNDLMNVAATRSEMCCALCAERRAHGCRAYTWTNYEGGTCWLKSARGTTTISMGTVSGEYGS